MDSFLKTFFKNSLPAGLKGSGLTSGPPSSLTSPMTSPTSSPCHHPLRNHHTNGHHHHHHHRGSIDSVFVDLDLSGSGTEFGAASGLAAALGNGLSNDGIGGVVDLRALAKDRQKKDNHNMSKSRHLIWKIFVFLYFFWVVVVFILCVLSTFLYRFGYLRSLSDGVCVSVCVVGMFSR